MATLEEVFRDREQYPDDQTITIGGQEMTMKELRDKALPKSDATRYGERSRQEAEAYRQRAHELESMLLDNQQKMALMAQGNEVSSQDDPYMSQLKKMQEQNEAINRRLQEHETGFYLAEYNRQLDKLNEKDKDLDRRQLVDFAKSKQILNLEDAYKLFYHDKLMKQAQDKSAAAAREQAMKESRLPRFPFPGIKPKRESSAPTWKDADLAENDPDMWDAFNKTQ